MTKQIANYPNYTVDEAGNVYGRKKKIRPFVHRDGYLKVWLYNHGKRRKFFVHRLVAEAFIPNPKRKPLVNHKDCNRANNAACNLEWVTHSENVKWAVACGTHKCNLPNVKGGDAL